MNSHLYKDKKFKVWNSDRLAEALCDEWSELGPQLFINIESLYGFKATRIAFKGEVNVTIDISRPKIREGGQITPLFNLSLSPDPDDIKFHVLNTFQLNDIVSLHPRLSDKKTLFVIGAHEPWENSHFKEAAQLSRPIIEVLLRFETCFQFLVSDEYPVAGYTLDTSKLLIDQYLNRIKAYRLAEIYGHPEKLDNAIVAIRDSAETNDMAKQRLEKVCNTKSAGSANWLYTTEMIDRLCN